MAVAAGTLGMMVWGAGRLLERTERSARDTRITAMAGLPYNGSKEIQISVNSLDLSDVIEDSDQVNLRIGIAFDNRIAYWASPIGVQTCNSRNDAQPIETFVRSRRNGRLLIAAGPIGNIDGLDIPDDSRWARGPIILIDGEPYSVVERKSVEYLVESRHREPRLAAFDDVASGDRGEVEISYEM